MASHDHDPEDEALRSVTLENAQTILAFRQRAEQALRGSDAVLVDFFENASVGLHCVGPDGTILRVNQAELKLLGYSRDEYLGRDIAEFHVDREVIADIMRRLRAGETIRDREARMRCKDGSIRHVLIDSSVLWRDGEFVHTRCFTRDVTDRKRVGDAHARLAAIVESSADAIIGKTLDSRILTWNTAAERLFGYPAEEIVGRKVTILIPADRQDEERRIIEKVRRGERVEPYDTERVARDGRRIDVSITVSPVRDEEGRVIAASTIARDVTASKRAEQALRRAEETSRFLADASTTLAQLTDQVSTLQRVASLAVPAFADWCAVDMLEPDGSLRRLAATHADPVKVRLAHDAFRRYPPGPDDTHPTRTVLRRGEPL
jgi:PAS domain S-box-containing protein